MARYQVHHFLFFFEKKGDNPGTRLSNTTGDKMMQIHRRSYLIPRKKEGSNSLKDKSGGLKAKKVANLNTVKTIKKISSRLAIHRMVLGILNLVSIKRATKEGNLSMEDKVLMLYFHRSSIFAK